MDSQAGLMNSDLVGQRVRFLGLAARSDLNGQHGTVTGFNKAKGRYAVKIDGAIGGSQAILVKPTNLERIPSEQAPCEEAPDEPTTASSSDEAGPNGWRCYVNDTMLPDGRPISAHCVMAVMEGKLDVLKALLDPLTEKQTEELMQIDHWNGLTILDVACNVGDCETIAYLVGKGADVHGQEHETKQTCLHMAAARGNAAAVQLLVQRLGANPLALDRNGCSPFHHAAIAGDTPGHVAALQYLLSLKELGCPLHIDQPDGTAQGRTALGWAVEKGHTNVAAWLKSNGAVLELNPRVPVVPGVA